MYIKVDTSEFNRTLKAYMAQSKRSLAEIVNQKGYSIAMSATKLTRKADYNKMYMEVGPTAEVAISQNFRILKSGAIKKGKVNKQKVFAARYDGTAPRLALIINKFRGRQGKKGLYGGEMREAVEREWARRAKSIAFLRAGWLFAVAGFAKAIGKRVNMSTEKTLSSWKKQGMGGATPARSGWVVQAELWNAAFGRAMHSKERAAKFAEMGLRAAMNQEVRRMKEHMEDKLQKDSDRIVGRMLR